MQRSHRRSTKVCTRCRHRKTKCDFKFPQCTSCRLANASCLGFDPSTRKPVPRRYEQFIMRLFHEGESSRATLLILRTSSLVRSLEARVAELEAEVLAFRTLPQNLPYLMASKIAQATISFGVPSSSSFVQSKISPALFFRPSCPPVAISADIESNPSHDGHAPNKSSNQPDKPYTSNLIDLNSIPNTALIRMVKNYADIHLPQYPCISESLLERILDKALHEEQGDIGSSLIYGIPSASGLGHFEYFILFIVLAISANTLTWKAEEQARAASESFFKSAVKYLQVYEDYSEIKQLQISLLLAHYAHMCPERVDNWTCIANAIRIMLSLGLHHGCPEGLDAQQARQRTELFWVAYGMERSLCTNLRLPLSFPEESITTKLKDPSPSSDFDSHSSVHNARRKSSCNHICRYRGLETEVHRVLYLEEDIGIFGYTSLADWIPNIMGRLEKWYTHAQTFTQYNMLEFKHVQFYHLRVRIHRPTPRLQLTGPEDWEIVLESCRLLIEDYLGQERVRRLFYPWHGVHILFEVTVIALHAAWSSRDYEPLRSQAELMLQILIPQCLQLLNNIGQRWSEATRCADKLRPLVQKVLAAFNNTPTLDNVSIAEEIQGLLFSDKSLKWSDLPLGEIDFDFEDGSALLDQMLNNNVEFFNWEPEWDIISNEMI